MRSGLPRSIRLSWLTPALGALVLLSACERPAAVVQEDVRPVRVMTVSSTSMSDAQSYPAEIRPRVESRLGFRVAGKIIQRLVDAGAVVKAGQPLARLDARDLQLSESAARAQVASAQANYELAEVALKRTEKLASSNFVSSAQVDQAQTQLRAARAQLDQATAIARAQGNQAAYATLVADRDGVVTAIEAEAGQVVSAGTAVVRVAVGRDKDVVFSLPEQAARVLKPGESVGVSLWSAPNVSLSAKVRDVSPTADPATRTYVIKAALDDPDNVATLGLTASAHVQRGPRRDGLIVPLSSVVSGADGRSASVWVIDQDVARRTAVTIGGPAGSGLLISSGLQPGQVIATAGVHTLKDGQKVRPMTEGAADGVAQGATATAAKGVAEGATPGAAKP